jgi:hypothetical protein
MDGMARWSSARVEKWIVKDSSHYRFVDSLSLVYGSQIQTVELTRIRGQADLPQKARNDHHEVILGHIAHSGTRFQRRMTLCMSSSNLRYGYVQACNTTAAEAIATACKRSACG